MSGKKPQSTPNPPTSSDRPAADAAVRPPVRTLSPRKLWLFRMAAILLSLSVLVLVEAGFRLAGVGQNLRLVVRAPENPLGLTHQMNGAVDLAFYGAADLTGPETRRFRLPKPRDTYRIVFLGGSTVIGFPYASELAFPRQTEVQLQRQNPDLKFEVFNVGITSINSFSVVDLLEQCLDCEPDLIVVHTGHNEFYGPGGPGSSAVSVPYPLVRPMFALRRCRTSQLVESVSPFRRPMSDDLLDTLPRTLEIPLNGAVFERAKQNLRRNLERSVAIADQHRVPILLSTVASNLKDQSPLRSVWPSEISPDQQARWERDVRRGESLLRQGELTEALAAFHKAEETLEHHARLSYRKAQCLEALGRNDEALAAYKQARDEDACRFRAPSVFADIVREVADRSANASFLDVEQQVNAESSPAGPGHDYFFEHVHYTFAGHVSLGRMFARGIQEQVLRRPWLPERVPSREELETLLGVVPEDHLAAYSSAIEVMQTGPLKSALDAARHEEHIKKLIAEGFFGLDPTRREAFADIPMNIMVNDLIGGLVFIHRVRGNTDLSEEFARLAAVRRPWMVGSFP